MTSKIPAITITLVKNSGRYLSEVLTTLDGLDEILLLGNGSTDRTSEIVVGLKNISIHKYEFVGFGPMKNLAARLAHNDWIFSIDSNGVVDAELIESIRATVVENRTQKMFSPSYLNHYDDHLIKTCGWYPDIVPHLYRRRFIQFSDRQVHGSLKLSENTEAQILADRLKHYSFENVGGLIRKVQQYSTLYAEENRYKKPVSPAKALLHGGASFMKNYFLERDFACSSNSPIISATNTQGSHYKYIKLYERNRHITATLTITTYDHPGALELVLKSALAQTCPLDEIIVVDGDSAQDIIEVVDAFKRISPVPVKHSWRPDGGFCATELRNRAIAAALSDYITLMGGDMPFGSSFIVDHLRLARRGHLIQGSRVILTGECIAALLENSSLPALPYFSTGIKKGTSALRPRLPTKIADSHGNRKHKGIKTCNMGFFRNDALTASGFSNEFAGWGCEDNGFVTRCYHTGMKYYDPKFTGIVHHLWRHEAERDSLP